SCAHRSGVMRVAGGSHRQTSDLRIFESVAVVTAERGCCIKDLDRVHGKRLQSCEPYPRAEQIVRMRRNGKAAALVDDVADFARRFSFQVRQFGANTQKMPVRGGDLDSRKYEKIVDG